MVLCLSLIGVWGSFSYVFSKTKQPLLYLMFSFHTFFTACILFTLFMVMLLVIHHSNRVEIITDSEILFMVGLSVFFLFIPYCFGYAWKILRYFILYILTGHSVNESTATEEEIIDGRLFKS